MSFPLKSGGEEKMVVDTRIIKLNNQGRKEGRKEGRKVERKIVQERQKKGGNTMRGYKKKKLEK